MDQLCRFGLSGEATKRATEFVTPECRHSQTGREIKKDAAVLNSISLYTVMRASGKDVYRQREIKKDE